MRVYFLRHGEADWPLWEGLDDERPLTEKGKKQLKRVAKFMATIGMEPGAVLTSPLLRATQTAKIAAVALNVPIAVETSLAPGFSVAKMKKILSKHVGQDLMLVGHEPDFSQVIEAVTGATIKMAKAGLARVDFEDDTTHGTLVWLAPPKLTARR